MSVASAREEDFSFREVTAWTVASNRKGIVLHTLHACQCDPAFKRAVRVGRLSTFRNSTMRS